MRPRRRAFHHGHHASRSCKPRSLEETHIVERRPQLQTFSSSAAFDYGRYHDNHDYNHHQQHSHSAPSRERASPAALSKERNLGSGHCGTCKCDAKVTAISQAEPQQGGRRECHLPPSAFTDDLPPPLPLPKYSFHKRLTPSNLVPLSSRIGRERFLQSLSTGNAEAYLPLAEQFLNQSDPAFCGVTTLAMILNACAVDPNVRWRGGWRWYGNDDVVLDRCCLGNKRGRERVRRVGVSLEEFAGLGRCQGLGVTMKRPCLESASSKKSCGTIDEFRRDMVQTVRMPPLHDAEGVASDRSDLNKCNNDVEEKRGFFVVSFSREHLNQTGSGHFSPIAAYDPPSDSCLILDVARFKYAPYWVSVHELYEATKPIDESTGKSRGWFLLSPPEIQQGGYQGIKKRDEGKLPADVVPIARSEGENNSASKDPCPLGSVKVKYCRVSVNGAFESRSSATRL